MKKLLSLLLSTMLAISLPLTSFASGTSVNGTNKPPTQVPTKLTRLDYDSFKEWYETFDYSKQLTAIELNTKNIEGGYKAAAILPINWMPGNTNFKIPESYVKEKLSPLLSNVDILEWSPPNTDAPSALLAEGDSVYIRNANYLYENGIISPRESITVKEDSRFSVSNAVGDISNPRYFPKKTEALMALVKAYGGVIPSRLIVENSRTILPRPSEPIFVSNYKFKDKLNSALPNGSNTTVSYPYGDMLVYSSPNVPELYIERAISKGIITMQELNPGSQTAYDLSLMYNKELQNSSGQYLPRWSNKLDPVQLNSTGLLSPDISSPLTGQTRLAIGSNPFGSSFSFGVKLKSDMKKPKDNPLSVPVGLSGVELPLKHEIIGASSMLDNTVNIAQTGAFNNFTNESMTLWDFYKLLYEAQLAYDETITETEMDFVKFAFGVNFTSPPDTHKVLGQLVVTGVIDPEKPSEVSDIYRPLTNEEMYKLLYRVHQKGARLTFKVAELSATDSFFREKGFSKNAVNVSSFDTAPPSIRPRAEVIKQKTGDKNNEDLFTVNYALTFSTSAPPPAFFETNWFFIRDNKRTDLGYRGVDYKLTKISNNRYVFSLTEEFFKKVSARGVNTVELNSPGEMDVPVKITLPEGPGDYDIELDGNLSTNNYTYKGVITEKYKTTSTSKDLLDELLDALFPVSFANTNPPPLTTTNTYSVSTTIYAFGGDFSGILDTESGEPLNKAHKLTDLGGGYYQLSKDIQAKDKDTACAILDKSITLKSPGTNTKMLGFTVDNETLVAQSDLGSYGIVRIKDKLLFNEKTGTFMLIIDDKDIVMIGSAVYKFPKNTTMVSTSGEAKGEIYYNLKAIATLLTNKEVQYFNNKDLVMPSDILDVTKSRKEICNINNEKIDTFISESYGPNGRNFFSTASMTNATKNFTVSYVKDNYDVLYSMDQSKVSGLYTAQSATTKPSPNDVQSRLNKPPADANEKKKWHVNRALLSAALSDGTGTAISASTGYVEVKVKFCFDNSVPADKQKEFIDKYKTFALTKADASAGLTEADFAANITAVNYADDAGKKVTDDADEVDRVIKYPNNSLFISAKYAGISKNGQRWTYNPQQNSTVNQSAIRTLDFTPDYSVDINGLEYQYYGTEVKNGKLFAKYEPVKYSFYKQAEASQLKIQNEVAKKLSDIIGSGKGVAGDTVIVDPFNSFYRGEVVEQKVLEDSYILNENGDYFQFKKLTRDAKIEYYVPDPTVIANGKGNTNLDKLGKWKRKDKNKNVLVSEMIWLSADHFKVDTKTNTIVYDTKAVANPTALTSEYFTLSIITPLINSVVETPHYDLKKGDVVLLGGSRMVVQSTSPNSKEVSYITKLKFSSPLSASSLRIPKTFEIDGKKIQLEIDTTLDKWMFADSSTVKPYMTGNIDLIATKVAKEAGMDLEETITVKDKSAKKAKYQIGDSDFSISVMGKCNFAVHSLTLKGPLMVLYAPEKNNPYYIMLPPLTANPLGLVLSYDIMDGESLDYSGNAFSVTEKEGDWLASRMKDIKLFDFSNLYLDFEVASVLDFILATLHAFALWLFLSYTLVYSLNKGGDLKPLRRLYDVNGIDVVKYFTLGTWSLQEDYGFLELSIRILVIVFTAQIIL